MTKIDIFSGFLGAGKTTLIKKMIAEAFADEKLVLIENEFGDIGIDGAFLKEAGIEITEMNSGCICCSLVGDFSRALGEVLTRFAPDRVLIEPSGVGKLSDVIRAVQNVGAENAVLNSYTTVVDAKKCKMYMKNFGEFFCDQVACASTIVLSHTNDLNDEKVAACVELLREHNESAAIVTTSWDALDGKQILAAIEKTNTLEAELAQLSNEHHHHHHDEECDCHEHHHHHDEEYDCHEHHHHHDEECDCHEHHHHHDEDCDCHEHHHHDEECDCHEHHHHHDEECDCHERHHHHDEECDCHEHHHHHHDHDHGEECTCGCHDHDHHHHHADEVFSSFGRETARRYTQEEIADALEALASSNEYGMVLRAKGIVAGKDGDWIHFDYVPGEPDVRTGGADVIGRLCVIGSELDEEAIARLFCL